MYCITCGKELIKKDTDAYDFKTGNRCYKFVCPTNQCGHYGHDHQYRELGWFGRQARCLRCGHITQCVSD